MKALLFIALVSSSAIAEMVDHEADLKALPTAPPGFEVKEFAREPLVRQPCSMAFDARGRLFLGMGPQYRNPKPETPGDSVVIVEDTNGDGVADHLKVFATGLNAVQGLAWHGRDLWVANSPDLTIVRDLDGDDVADEYVRVYTDLGNIEHALHGLDWAPDGKLYMSKGNSKGLNLPDRYAPKPFRELWGLPTPAGAQDFPPPQTAKAADYHPAYHDPKDDWGQMGGVLRCDDLGRNLEIVARGLRNPWDITFDSGFDWLGTDNDQNEGDRIFMPFLGAHFGWGHAWSANWTGENHLPTVPISGPVFTGSGTGVVFYDVPQFPEKFRHVFFINDWLRKTMFVYRPRWDGALRQPEGGEWQPFVVGGKSLFRPTDLEVGPDGALWCLGWSTGYGSEWKDGEMTNEGRIFRIAWKDAPPVQRVMKPIAQQSVPELIEDFAGPLPVWRIDAQEELVHRGAKAELIAALESGKLNEMRETWTAWTLGRIAPGDPFFLRKVADEKTPLNLRLQCARILAQGKSLPDSFAKLLENAEPRLRFAAVQGILRTRDAHFIEPLLALAARETDRLTFYSAWQALRDCSTADALRKLLSDSRGGVRRAALLALADTGATTEAEVQPLLKEVDGQTAALAALWLAKHRSNPLISFQPDETDFTKDVKVKIKGTLKPSDLRYTLDGSEPTATSPRAKDGIVLDKTTTVKAGLFVSGMMVGAVAEMTYRKAGETAAPVVSLLTPPTTPTTMEAALGLRGDAARGEQLFLSAGGAGCANCHRVGTRGINFGPDLTGLGARADVRHVVQSMLDPSAVITEGFNTNLITTTDGTWSGILLEESGVELTLGLMDGKKQRIEKAKITKRETLPTSAMPPFASVLQPQQCADIAAWLLSTPAELAVAEKPDRLVITQGGAPLAEFVFDDKTVQRPFFANICAPGGVKVTRNYPPIEGQDPTDHFDMHPGMWFGFGDISGHDFWRNESRIRHERFTEAPVVRDGRLHFASENTLITPNGDSLARFESRVTIAPRANGTLFTWAVTFTPTGDGFFFGDQEEMGFGVRVATPLTEKNGGEIVNNDGVKSAKRTWGQPGAWCDYSGSLGTQRVGVAIFPDPKNFRPSWWHNRDYGVFVANPFGRKAMKQGDKSRVEVAKGERFTLRYGAFVHSTPGESPADIAAAYTDFCATP